MDEGNGVPPGAEPEGAAGAGPIPDGDFELAGPRPGPLHEPDPYSTPPYGEPGPWAPAPPVQHPAAAPVHGAVTAAPAVGAVPPRPASPPATPVPAPVVPPAPAAAPLPARQPPADPWGRHAPWAAGPLPVPGAVPVHGGRPRRRRVAAGWTLAVALVAAGTGGLVGGYAERAGAGSDVRPPRAGSVPAGRAPDSVAGIAARALPGVVTLHVSGSGEEATGTGFVLDDRGHILTNNHVVAAAASGGGISATFTDGTSAKATVVGRDSGYDLAVIQVGGVHGLTPLPLGDSDDVRVGDPVVAIGAPFDLAGTVTSGIISAKDRPVTAGGEKSDGSDVSYVDALQTDAPINPGNSGGPLLDSRARVIGINSAIRSADSGSATGSGQAGSIGLGFAIPVNQAKRVAEQLIADGHATHPVIGVRLDMGYTGDGARVGGAAPGGGPAVVKGGPGERAGLRPGDLITGADGEPVHTGAELIVRIRAHEPGDRMRLTVRRGGTEREVSLVLGTAEQN
ncbi:trypsin-like peptidase domain-containing protein [Streptomyces malaysiense]|uniref:Protease n=1 Tax=Streptomyces malaysiense TaxID=1428626 RepID=A0A1J4PZV9_9ACTN|nr:trypsin-like peptidase domain-containing protein [Streptomyces malaysiense]OIK26467.1 protease [Streptomyces malaysiense]